MCFWSAGVQGEGQADLIVLNLGVPDPLYASLPVNAHIELHLFDGTVSDTDRQHAPSHDFFVCPVPALHVKICGSFMIINGTIHAAAATATGVPVTPVEADIPPAQASRQDALR